MSEHLTIVQHPLVQHKLTFMRDKSTSTGKFRRLLREISLLLGYEVLRDLPMTTTTVETPLQEMTAPVLAGKKVALVSILRAGNGLLDGVLELVPSARVGFVGLYRDEETLKPVQYYFKVPGDLAAPRPRPSICSSRPARATSASCACSPRPRASRGCTRRIRTCAS